MRRGRLLKTLKKILKMETYKTFYLFFKKHQASPAFHTKLQDTLEKKRVPFETRGETRVSAARAERGFGSRRADAAGARPGSRFPGAAAGRAVPRAESRGRRGRFWPLCPHRHFRRRPSPPRTWTRGPARAHPSSSEGHLGSRSPGSGRLAGSLLPPASALGAPPRRS